METTRIAIIGAGNIGTAIGTGLVASGGYRPEMITLTRRKTHLLEQRKQEGFVTSGDNREAVRRSEVLIVAVEPQQIDGVLAEIAPELDPERHVLISVVTGVGIARIRERLGRPLRVVRAMPNTAIAVGEAMTCIAGADDSLETARSIFERVGRVLVIDEEQMLAATALGACGVAFFLRAIRAASQGGIEIGFHAEESLAIAAQTARGAASLLLSMGSHPEHEIDKVATPRGCTIAGLNRMEYEGFSSAMIRGITVSSEKASKLYESGRT